MESVYRSQCLLDALSDFVDLGWCHQILDQEYVCQQLDYPIRVVSHRLNV